MRPVKQCSAILAIGFFLAAAAPALPAETGAPPAAPLRDGYPTAVSGLLYKDAATNVIIYVETDGRNVVAISPEGKILWRKDPFVDVGLEPYRQARPTIDYVGPGRALSGSDRKVFVVRFTSSQFGVMDIATGEFTFGGQD